MGETVIFETSHRVAADRALALLTEARIPTRCAAAAGGLEWQGQIAPVDAPGVRWIIRVPAGYKEAAERKLAPLLAEEDDREASVTTRAPRGSSFMAIAILAVLFAAILTNSCPR